MEVIEDGGESAKSMERPGLQRCLALMRAGAARGLLVFHLDRLTRHVGDLVGLVESTFVEPDGLLLLSVSQPIETRTAVGRMQIYILAVVGQYQREAGVEQTASIMRSKRSHSERTGNLRFGQRVDPDDPRRSKKSDRPIALVPCQEDIDTEAVIRGLRSEGLSYRAIAAALNDLGIPGKRGITMRSTGLWSKSSVHEILTRAGDPAPSPAGDSTDARTDPR